MSDWTLEKIEALDADDPLAGARARFSLPDGVIYLDGNSLGALPVASAGVIADVVQRQWGEDLITSWNKNDWINMPTRIGDRIAPLIGASADEVVCADSTSVNLFKMVVAATRMRPGRRKILTESVNFPTDQYVMQGINDLLGDAVELVTVPGEDLADAIDDETAVLSLTHTSYRTGAVHDMAGLTASAHEVGALTVWDLSHSAGALPVHLNGARADFAVGCGYKYLNGGPGAPAFLFVAERHQPDVRPPLSGWMGHASPFDFAGDYRPADGVLRNLCGTPGVLGLAALDAGLDTFDGIDMADIRTKSKALGDLFLDLIEDVCSGQGFEIGCPRDADARGSQVSLRHGDGYAIVQALIAEGVIGDFRAPDVMRFGFAPLYVSYRNVWDAVHALADIMATERWQSPEFQEQGAVT